jgi:acyl-CoA synthetase (AMP-forming)/AMP-acid ligase II
VSDLKLFPILERAARNWPNDVAQVRGPHRLTFHQLKTAAEHLAAEFLRANIKPGDKVGLLCPNGPEYVIGSLNRRNLRRIYRVLMLHSLPLIGSPKIIAFG